MIKLSSAPYNSVDPGPSVALQGVNSKAATPVRIKYASEAAPVYRNFYFVNQPDFQTRTLGFPRPASDTACNLA